ncbi:MAG: hypothetical protein E7630_01440 [Ruminococcaceae bacterium]|nr:hypothetical protein [Oscillospiraceae bacterium]
MNDLKIGYSKVDITPSMGTPISGYYQERYAEGILDSLQIVCLAARTGEKTALLLSADLLGIYHEVGLVTFVNQIAEATGVDPEGIYIHCTHTHTGPTSTMQTEDPVLKTHQEFLGRRFCDAALLAIGDLKPAKMGWAVGNAPNVAFIRRFRMKDGKVRTNPGVGNPDILHPIGDVDERVSVLRFDREGADTVVLVNFGNHPDVVGGSLISADWPGFLRRRLEKSLDNVKCIFFNGAEGDVNHVNVNAKGGDLNDTFNDFDDVARGYGHARHIGNVLAGAVLQVYDKVNYVDVESVRFMKKTVHVESNRPDPEDLPRAYEIDALHKAGRDDELPFRGMELTTEVAKAARMIRLKDGPDFFPMVLSAVAIGNVALIGIPGEPFTGIGRGLKEAEGWSLVLPTCITNGNQGYFPMKEAYDEGGYEAGTSPFRSGTAEKLIAEGCDLLRQIL